ncbi:MAG: imidazoleglycerol-phosphate dehydratase HisB [Candidatus Methanofastidiosia archaeon]
MRKASVKRETEETSITISLNLDGKGNAKVNTGIGFFDHMLKTFAKHGLFDMEIKACGDLEVDQHHTIEDVGITLGQAFDKALGRRKGINRTGYFAFPMDEALSIVAIDISGRPNLQFQAEFRRRFIGELDSDLIFDFFKGFADALKASITVRIISGRNDHHKAESIFKAFGKSAKMACSLDPRAIEDIPSTKGVIG